jgi:hypothetical protein
MCNRGSGRRLRLRYGATAVAALALCAGAICLYACDPAASNIYPICPFHAVTGLHCPGCGTARAMHQLLHGNVWAAMRLNLLAVVLLPPLAYGSLSIALRFVGRKPLPGVFIPASWIWTLLAVIILFWILRNVPCYPFSLLAPQETWSGEQLREPQGRRHPDAGEEARASETIFGQEVAVDAKGIQEGIKFDLKYWPLAVNSSTARTP